MTMTRGAGVGLQVLSIPFVALGAVLTAIGIGIAVTSSPMDAAWSGGIGLLLLLVGVWMLKSGKRAAGIKWL
jgi:hypothetical protein